MQNAESACGQTVGGEGAESVYGELCDLPKLHSHAALVPAPDDAPETNLQPRIVR